MSWSLRGKTQPLEGKQAPKKVLLHLGSPGGGEREIAGNPRGGEGQATKRGRKGIRLRVKEVLCRERAWKRSRSQGEKQVRGKKEKKGVVIYPSRRGLLTFRGERGTKSPLTKSRAAGKGERVSFVGENLYYTTRGGGKPH